MGYNIKYNKNYFYIQIQILYPFQKSFWQGQIKVLSNFIFFYI